MVENVQIQANDSNINRELVHTELSMLPQIVLEHLPFKHQAQKSYVAKSASL